jgi:hypothetical protein
MLESLASKMVACMQDSFDGRDIKCLDLKIKIFLNDFVAFKTAMKERVETNVKATDDYYSFPSDDGEH